MPVLSIIIPFYNSNEKVAALIDSLNKQVAWLSNKVEILFINDGSTDDTVTYINNNMKLSDYKIHHKKNGGVSTARNFGLDISNGEYIIFIDSDDYILTSGLSLIINEINKNKNNDVFIFNYSKVIEGKEITTGLYEDFPPVFFLDRYISGELLKYISVTSCVFKKEYLLINNIRYNVNAKYAEDQDFLVRAVVGGDYILINKPIVGYNVDLSTAMNLLSLRRFDSINIFLSWRNDLNIDSNLIDKKINRELIYICRSFYKKLTIKKSISFYRDNIAGKYNEYIMGDLESVLFFKFNLIYILLYKAYCRFSSR